MKSSGLIFTIAVISLSSTVPQLPRGAPKEWGAGTQGLRMALSLGPPSDVPKHRELYVAIENTGDADVVLNLGYMLANGKVMFPTAIQLIVTDTEGNTREMHFSDKRYPAVAGRMDDFIVAARSGSTYTLRTNLDQYVRVKPFEFLSELPAGRYWMMARFNGDGARTPNGDMQGVALLNFWKGTLASNSIEFELAR